MILVGDIGGTNTRLAVVAAEGGGFRVAAEARYASPQYSGLEEIAAEFLEANKLPVTHAGFGVAGPVQDGQSHATNLPWVVDAGVLARRLKIASVELLNDLEAIAFGIATLGAADFLTLQTGNPAARGNAAVIAPGTGLGEAGLFWDGNRHHPYATEGGHTSFSPSDELEDELLLYLRPQFQHVSWERILSGPGLFNIYKFLRDTGRGTEPPWLTEQMKQGDPSPLISQAALEGRSELCGRALDLFVRLLGAEAGNLALKTMARGGVYLGGGIPPKILPRLDGPNFRTAFTAKGRLRQLLEGMPIRVILNGQVGLRGAAHFAMLHSPAGPRK